MFGARFLGTALAFGFGVLASAPATEPSDEEKKDADTVNPVYKAAETAEVHGIGVSQPLHSRFEDVKDWPTFIPALRAKRGAAARVWELLTKTTQDRVSDDKYVDAIGDPAFPVEALVLKAGVASDLRRIIGDPDFYHEGAFKAVPLTQELKNVIALGKKRTALQTARLNWTLLAKAFPGCIPDIPEQFRSVRVQVAAGKNVVLVLSSNEACRWEVKCLEGAKVTGVLLCGYHTQEVAGVDAPTVYRCYYGPDGVTVLHPDDYFYGYDEKKDTFKDFVKSVKGITGKEFTSFQGKYSPKPGDEPYTIRPKAK